MGADCVKHECRRVARIDQERIVPHHRHGAGIEILEPRDRTAAGKGAPVGHQPVNEPLLFARNAAVVRPVDGRRSLEWRYRIATKLL
jgi:hypothetical protein